MYMYTLVYSYMKTKWSIELDRSNEVKNLVKFEVLITLFDHFSVGIEHFKGFLLRVFGFHIVAEVIESIHAPFIDVVESIKNCNLFHFLKVRTSGKKKLFSLLIIVSVLEWRISTAHSKNFHRVIYFVRVYV